MDKYLDVEHLRKILGPGVTLQDAIELISGDFEEELHPESVFVEPPEAAVITDEESGDEEDQDLRHLPGRQLMAQAEIVFSNFRLGGVAIDPETDAHVHSDNTSGVPLIFHPVTHSSEWIKNRLKKGKPNPKFITGDFECSAEEPFAVDMGADEMTCVDMFERFFSDEIYEHLRIETEKYTRFKNCELQNISKEEIKCFVGILILSGYNTLPSVRNYWDQSDDMKNMLVSNNMRRNRFLTIMRFIHCADNQVMDKNDKVYKLRPLMDIIKNKCFENFPLATNLNYDESMIRFFGRNSLKQFLPGKPIRFGFKMWCLNSTDGYLLNFDLYQGKNTRVKDEYNILFGKAAAPFITMLDELPDEIKKQNINFFFDNLFSGVNLFRYLKVIGFTATGTFRENRLPKTKNMKVVKNEGEKRKSYWDWPPKSNFSKMPRGTFKYMIEKKNGILFARWKDNGVVTAGSTKFGVEPTSQVKRYSQELKKNVTVARPALIGHYNKHMGGTDLMDNNISNYRINVRSKKWWWPIFTWLVDVCVQNAWILYKKRKPISQLDFRREIVRTYLNAYGVQRQQPGPSGSRPSSMRTPVSIRLDKMDHFVCSTPNKKRRRCAMDKCSSHVRTMCSKCDVGLCIDCFLPYHTK